MLALSLVLSIAGGIIASFPVIVAILATVAVFARRDFASKLNNMEAESARTMCVLTMDTFTPADLVRLHAWDPSRVSRPAPMPSVWASRNARRGVDPLYL